jgi:toxin CcdB
MAQFDVHVLADGTTAINIQSDLLGGYRTTLVAPLPSADDLGMPPSRLHPSFRVDARRLLLAPQLASAVPSRVLGPATVSLAEHEYAIKAALDMVISGY